MDGLPGNPEGVKPHLTASEVDALVHAHLHAGYSYTQEELDAGTVSPEDVKSVRDRLCKDLASRGIDTPEPEDVPERGNWEPA